MGLGAWMVWWWGWVLECGGDKSLAELLTGRMKAFTFQILQTRRKKQSQNKEEGKKVKKKRMRMSLTFM